MTTPCESVVELAFTVLLLGAVGLVALALVLECQYYLEIAHAAVHDYLFPPDDDEPVVQIVTCDSPIHRVPWQTINKQKKPRWSNAKKREAKNRG